MATVSQMLALRAICAVILFRQALAFNDCNKSVTDIEKCWKEWFTEFDTLCNDTFRVVRCANIYQDRMNDCHFQFRWEALERIKFYTRAMQVGCDDKFLQEEVPKNEDCWKKARECAEPLVFIIKDKKSEDCLKAIKSVDECASTVEETHPKCPKIVDRFVDQLIPAICGAISLKSTSAILVSIIGALLTVFGA